MDYNGDATHFKSFIEKDRAYQFLVGLDLEYGQT